MKATFATSMCLPLLFLLCCAFHLQLATAGKGSGESGEQDTRRHTCGDLVEEPPKSAESTPASPPPSSVPTPPPGECVCTPAAPTDNGGEGSSEEGGHFHSKCKLVQAFYNLSLTLTIEQQLIWEAWIQEIEDTILVNVSLTNDQKVVLVSLSLEAFFSVNIDIYKKLSYGVIPGWGVVEDFLHVSISIQLEITQSIVTLDANGDCDLLDAIRNASEECACSAQEKSAFASLLIELQAILEDSSYTYEQQLAVVFQLCQSFIVQNPSLEKLLLSIHIHGYGSVESLMRVCHTVGLFLLT